MSVKRHEKKYISLENLKKAMEKTNAILMIKYGKNAQWWQEYGEANK